MTLVRKQALIGDSLASVRAFTSAHAQQKTPGYNHKIPDKMMTPDKVETRIGTLDFTDGRPSSGQLTDIDTTVVAGLRFYVRF